MNFSLYIAKRYLFSKNSNNAINIIGIIAGLGVIVGSLALFLVLSVFSGLKSFSSNFLKVTDPDIHISATKGKSFLFSKEIQHLLDENKNIISYSKVLEERAFFKYKNKEQVAFIKGVDSNYTKVVKIDTLVFAGKWLNPNSNTAVVGNGISNKLSLGILNYGDLLNIYVPKAGKGYITNASKAFKQIHTQAIGVFSISEELDNTYVFTNLDLCQKLLQYDTSQISGIDIKVEQHKVTDCINSLKKEFGDNFEIISREEQNAVFYKILNTEKLVAYLIFTLVLIIALFNVIGSIIMMILDKKNNLRTLYNLGAPLKKIKKIFLLQGVLLSCFGLIIGLMLSTILIVLQNQFHLFMITSSIPYPIEFKISNVLIVSITIISLGYIASKIASTRISKDLIA